MGGNAIPGLQTGAHVTTDRDFLLELVRDLGLAIRRVQEFPADDEAASRLSGMLNAIGAFATETNVQAEGDVAPRQRGRRGQAPRRSASAPASAASNGSRPASTASK
jgi:hypothetical protein